MAKPYKIPDFRKMYPEASEEVIAVLRTSERKTGFRIGELLGVRYATDIDYERHLLYVNFREDNENGARAKNAE